MILQYYYFESLATFNYFTSFDELTKLDDYDDINGIYCVNMNLTELPKLPKSLNSLYCCENKLTSLPELPNSLEYLNCSKNKIKELPNLPNSLKYVCAQWNLLAKLPILPNSLLYLKCENNYIETIPFLPKSLNEFYIFGFNPIADIINDNFGSWFNYRKYQHLILKLYIKQIEHHFLEWKYNPKYKYCRDRLEKECNEFYKEIKN